MRVTASGAPWETWVLPKADRIWSPVPCDDGAIQQLMAELDVSPVTARLLCIRGLGDLERARRFLSPSLDDLLDPFALTDMRLAVDRILMHEFAIYSVIPPEGCAAILWRDSGRKVEAAEALKLTSQDLLGFGIIDEIVPEPTGGAHTNPELAATLLDAALERALAGVSALSSEARLDARYRKWRAMGNVGLAES